MSTLQSLSNHLKHLEEIHRELDEKITRHWEHHDSDDKVSLMNMVNRTKVICTTVGP